MKNSYSVRPAAFGMFLILVALFFPAAAPGFDGPVDKGKACSDCHTLKAAEAAELLEGVVREVRGVSAARVPGLYAVSVIGNDGRSGLVYLDFSGKYVISGVTIRLEDKQNISRMEMMDLNRVDTSLIPEEDSIVVGNPDAPNKVFLFTDPLCPFCKKLHPELKKAVQTDSRVVFFIKLLPLVSLHPDAMRISRTIMCEKSLKLLEASFAGEKIPDPKCNSDVVERTVKLAQDLGIGSTPTLVLPDGRIAPGYKTADQILELIRESRGKN